MRDFEVNKFRELLRACPKGPRIEFGVFKGATLAIIAGHDGETFGVDSFEGMPESTDRDVKDGWDPYPKGRLFASETFAKSYAPKAILIKGFVPEVLERIPERKFAFCHIDMDQYDSTLHALKWIWPRMLPKGIIVCDDYFEERDWLAAGAINEWAKTVGRPEQLGRKAWWTL